MSSYIIILSILSLVLTSPVEENNNIEEYIEIVKCFLEQQPLIDDVNSLITMSTTQDFSQAVNLLFKAYGNVQNAITKCIKKEITLEESWYSQCCRSCNYIFVKNSPDYKYCINCCKKY